MELKTSRILLLSVFLSLTSSSFSQSAIEDYFDTTVGKENLPLNNGTFYFTTFRTLDSHQFYNTNKFDKGTIVYDGQLYNAVNLKYDCHRDVLIFKPYGETENFGIILIEKKVERFTLNHKNFINLSVVTKDSLKNVTGYYEESVKNAHFTFYIKHKKDRRENIKDNTIFNVFGIDNSFFFFFKNAYYNIDSKKDVSQLFLEQKKEINAFYTDNSKLLKEDKTAFYEKLFIYIDQIITTK